MGRHRHIASRILFLAIAITASHADATTTGVITYIDAGGNTQTQSQAGGAEGVDVSSDRIIPSSLGDIFIHAQGSSDPGLVRTGGSVRAMGAPGGFAAQATAAWSDQFFISAPGYNSTMTGTFSGSVQVTGDMFVDFYGRTYSDAIVSATLNIDPQTGDGRRVVMGGGVRRAVGYDIIPLNVGTEEFVLVFENVPFIFDSGINLSMGMVLGVSVNAIDAGATGRADADYSHTMMWSGLNEVRDQNGNLLTAYTALSRESNFDFAKPAITLGVPEPGKGLLMGAGLLLLVWVKKKSSECPLETDGRAMLRKKQHSPGRLILWAFFTWMPILAFAAADTTFVASYGDDTNSASNCSRAKPCRMLSTALRATNKGGEIIILDSGHYDVSELIIMKSVSIVAPPGVFAQVSNIRVDSQKGIRVALKGLVIKGTPTSYGIGLEFSDWSGGPSKLSYLSIENLTIVGFQDGLYVSGPVHVQIVGTEFRNNERGAYFSTGTQATITGSQFFANSSFAVYAKVSTTGDLFTTALIKESIIQGSVGTNWSAAFGVAQTPGWPSVIIRFTDCVVTGNNNVRNISGDGRVESYGNNAIFLNGNEDIGVAVPLK